MTHDQSAPAPVEVTQADRDAVNAFHKRSFEVLFENAGKDAPEINAAHQLLLEAFARHRTAHAEAAEARNKVLEEALRFLLECTLQTADKDEHPEEWDVVIAMRQALGDEHG